MDFRLLGPVEVLARGRGIDAGPPRQRAVLAALLVDAGRLVRTEALIDRVWGKIPPAKARRTLQVHVTRIRKVLREISTADRPARLLRRADGYVLDIEPGRVDLHRFRQQSAAARHSDVAEDRAALLEDALRLWQGVPLAGIPGEWAARARVSWPLERLDTAVEWARSALNIGRHGDLIPALRRLAEEYPLSEPLAAVLVRALAADGRMSEAVAFCATTTALLVCELGVEPGAELQQLQQALLLEQPLPEPIPPSCAESTAAGSGPGRWPVPAQLPTDVVAFVGRTDQLTRLDAMLAGPAEQSAGVVISVMSGTAGVGKTALAVHWAHRVADRFPDGQLYVNLNGWAQTTETSPAQAMVGFLHALGVPPERTPVDPQEAAGLYRSLLAGRRVLVLLDNAANPDQVRPLLPGGSGCLVLVTSRDRLSGLGARDGARRLTLDPLSLVEAVALLRRVLGPDRVGAEQAATEDLARVCGGLPLALRIAAAHLTDDPHRRVGDLAADLTRGNPLAVLQVDGDPQTAVRGAFDLSYAVLPAQARRLFRLLGLVPGSDVTAPAAAALTGYTLDTATCLLDRLTAAHLVTRPSTDRYTLHDLLRRYAADQARTEDSQPERDAALSRLFDWYLRHADAAARLLYPQILRLPIPDGINGPATEDLARFGTAAAALDWLAAERHNLVAAIVHAAKHGPCTVCWLLADTLRGYFDQTRHMEDWQRSAQAALDATSDSEPQIGAALRLSLSMLHYNLDHYPAAVEHVLAAASLAAQAGWTEAQAVALNNLGNIHTATGDLRAAVDCHTRALAMNRRLGLAGNQAVNLLNAGMVHERLGELEQAADCHRHALDLVRQVGWPAGEARALQNLGVINHALGHLGPAQDHLTRALALAEELGHQYAAADTRNDLARVHRDTGQYTTALNLAHTALATAIDTGERQLQGLVHQTLGSIHLATTEPDQATVHYRKALDLALATDATHNQAEALLGLAAALHDQHRSTAARSNAQRALDLARRASYRLVEGHALSTLATIDLAIGDHRSATEHAERALAVYRHTRHRLGEARTLLILAQAANHDRPDTAQSLRRAAHLLLDDIGSPRPPA